MFLTVETTKNGITVINKVPEEQMYNRAYGDDVKIYKAQNIIFDNGFLKASGKRMQRLTSRRLNHFPEIRNNSRIVGSRGIGHFNSSKMVVPIEVMRKYYHRFINIGAIERHQDNAEYYKINLGVLYFDPKPNGTFKKLCFGGNIHYEGELYDLS